jgi:hypothetical protein
VAGIQLVTPEGDTLILTSAHYQHTALQEIRQILQQAGDFGFDDNPEPESDGAFHFPWFETRPGTRSIPFGQRVLAHLTLTPTTLEVEAMSPQRLDDCCQRLDQLLADRIHLVGAKTKDVSQALHEPTPRAESKEPVMLPVEVIDELEEKVLRQWIDDSIPALGGLTPREAVKTPAGRKRVLALIDDAARMHKRMSKMPGVFAPDYRKVKKMLGLE